MAEKQKLEEDRQRIQNWKRWGPYLSERQWSTVREDYSHNGDSWNYFPHDHARKRTYRWGEDGLMGITDRECRLCFSVALWNGKDPILKERLFGLTGPEGNHGEDVKEYYYYLDSSPTHSYMKVLYKYPQDAYPYQGLIDGARSRNVLEPEFELEDTGIFKENKMFDVVTEYAKQDPNDILIRITAHNRGSESAPVHILPTLWYRNTWIWGCEHEGCTTKPLMHFAAHTNSGTKAVVTSRHDTLEDFVLEAEQTENGELVEVLFTENETNSKSLWNVDSYTPYVKDAFHRYVINQESDAVNPKQKGTKAAYFYRFDNVPAGGSCTIRLRLHLKSEWEKETNPEKFFTTQFDRVFEREQKHCDEFYASVIPSGLDADTVNIARQSYAGLLWTKQFYHYVVDSWLKGDPETPEPPSERLSGRNQDWHHLFNRDIISMPDKWEYPWYAAWDLAFHMIPFCRVDSLFAKEQLLLLLREWYMHPNGQLPSYEGNFSDVNPPVHAWACLRVYKMTAPRGSRDHKFLARCFQKLMLNFTWWVNRKDERGKHLFAGGFLGLDNIGLFDRSKSFSKDLHLEQADGTAWMAFFCTIMLEIALELAHTDPTYEDMASKFFEHFVHITDAMRPNDNNSGLWNEEDGFYYDMIYKSTDKRNYDCSTPVRVKSLVGLIPLFSCLVLEEQRVKDLPGFHRRFKWFMKYQPHLSSNVTYHCNADCKSAGDPVPHYLLSVPTKEQLCRILDSMLDEKQFLSDFGIRSLSKVYEDTPYEMELNGVVHSINYAPADAQTYMFGGNSNWRGPIWFPINFLIIESLQRYYYFYGDSVQVECPTGSGVKMNLKDVAKEICRRLLKIFQIAKEKKDGKSYRPCHGPHSNLYSDDHSENLVLFYEYFHGDNGSGVGASHQTGWTALISRCIEIVNS